MLPTSEGVTPGWFTPPMHDDMDVMGQAADQHGLVTRRQAIDTGLTSSALQRRTASGILVPRHPRVLRAAGAPVTWRSEVLAAVMWAGEAAIASHRAAGALWQLDGIEPGAIEVTVPRVQAPQRRGVRVHRAVTLEPRHRSTIDGIPVAGICLTLVQLASVLRPDALATVLDSALVQGLTRADRVLDCVDLLGRRGRRGIGTLVELLGERMDGQRPHATRFERRLSALLERAGLVRPVRQFEIRIDEVVVARPDLAYPELMIAIEADSYRWHGGRSFWERDLDRRTKLAADGWLVLHFSWRKLVAEPEYVVKQVDAARHIRTLAA
jgi:hypothetical protein